MSRKSGKNLTASPENTSDKSSDYSSQNKAGKSRGKHQEPPPPEVTSWTVPAAETPFHQILVKPQWSEGGLRQPRIGCVVQDLRGKLLLNLDSRSDEEVAQGAAIKIVSGTDEETPIEVLARLNELPAEADSISMLLFDDVPLEDDERQKIFVTSLLDLNSRQQFGKVTLELKQEENGGIIFARFTRTFEGDQWTLDLSSKNVDADSFEDALTSAQEDATTKSLARIRKATKLQTNVPVLIPDERNRLHVRVHTTPPAPFPEPPTDVDAEDAPPREVQPLASPMCVITDAKGRVLETFVVGGDNDDAPINITADRRRRLRKREAVGTGFEHLVSLDLTTIAENGVAVTVLLTNFSAEHLKPVTDVTVRVHDPSDIDDKTGDAASEATASEEGDRSEDDQSFVSKSRKSDASGKSKTDKSKKKVVVEEPKEPVVETPQEIAERLSRIFGTELFNMHVPVGVPSTCLALLRFERRKEAADKWLVIPLADKIEGDSVAVAAKSVEKAIQDILPPFSIDLEVGHSLVLKDPKQNWDYTNIGLGFGWEASDLPEDAVISAGCILFDERGTELETVSLRRVTSEDGVVTFSFPIPPKDTLNDEEHGSEEGSEDIGDNSEDESHKDGESAVKAPAPNPDTDKQKIAINLSRIPEGVRMLALFVGMYSEDALPECEMYIRVLDRTTEVEREAARLALVTQPDRTCAVLAQIDRDPVTAKWQLLPQDRHYGGNGIPEAILDIEKDYRMTVPKVLPTIPNSVKSTQPRPLVVLEDGAFETTLAMIKPDAVAAGSTAKIIDYITSHGFVVVQRKRVHLNRDQAGSFYKEHRGKTFFEGLLDFMTSGPIEVLALSRPNAIQAWRTLMGPTDCAQARISHPLTIRAKFGSDKQRNAVHGSDSPISARREVAFHFPGTVQEPLPSGSEGVSYLSVATNPTLLKALTALCKQKPADPVRWLANYLLQNNPTKPAVQTHAL